MTADIAGDWPFWVHRMSRGRRVRQDDLERRLALHHLAGSGPFGGGPPFGGFGGGRGRKRRGDVRVALLLLLAEEPRNGYQLMQEIEQRSGGRWRPSPGSVYPTLQQLEDQGLIRAIELEGTKRFELTDLGREHLETASHTAPPWDAGDEAAEREIPFRRQVAQTAAAAMQVAQAGSEEQVARASELLAETRRGLYLILAEDENA